MSRFLQFKYVMQVSIIIIFHNMRSSVYLLGIFVDRLCFYWLHSFNTHLTLTVFDIYWLCNIALFDIFLLLLLKNLILQKVSCLFLPNIYFFTEHLLLHRSLSYFFNDPLHFLLNVFTEHLLIYPAFRVIT